MRIGIISPYSLTMPGGVQGQILGLARALRDRGIQARILGPCDGPPPETYVTPLGNSLPTSANGSIAPIAPDPAAALRTIRALREENFDLLHLHEPLAPGPTMTALVTKPAPLIGTFHAAGNSKAYKWLGPILKKMAGQLNIRCAVSQEAESLAKESLGGQYRLLFNAVEIKRYQNLTPKDESANEPAIFFLGRHEPRKGLGVLIEAMSYLPGDIRLKIAGEGPQTETLKIKTRNDSRIQWLGRLDEAAKNRTLTEAQVFCAPSLSGESFGVVLLEAMAAGTAIVASSLTAYSSVARDGKDAILVPPNDPTALSNAILEILNNPEKAQKMTASGEKRVQQYSMKHLAEVYSEIYEECLTHTHSPNPKHTLLA